MDWSGVDYLWIIVMFLSAVWTLILTAPIHYRASTPWDSDAMLHFSKSDEVTNSSTSWMAWGCVNVQQIESILINFTNNYNEQSNDK